MLKDLKGDNSGVVFITVLIIIIVTMVLAVSALSLNVSQIKSSENELKYLQAEVLADGGLSRMLTNQFSDTAGTVINFPETVGYTDFSISATIDPTGANPPGSASVPLDIDVTF